jgi:hypothetical protein
MRLGILTGFLASFLSVALLGPVCLSAANAQILDSDKGLKPGLKPAYYFAEMRNLREADGWMKQSKARSGPPVLSLDYAGVGGSVLTTKPTDFVLADMNGFLKFDQPGSYTFKVLSNDGVAIWLDGDEVFRDADVHGDRESAPFEVKVAAAGWHPVRVLYFERKGTSSLRVWWQPPGTGALVVVPASHYAHDPAIKN